MNKNLLLIILGAAALAVVGALVLVTPEGDGFVFEKRVSRQEPLSASSDVKIEQVRHSESAKKANIKKARKEKKKRDPSIKAVALDHYGNYLIQLIDDNPEDRDLEKEDSSYVVIEGKIDGKQFALKAPKVIIDRPGIKLKITNLKTKESTVLDATPLAEAGALSSKERIKFTIDTQEQTLKVADIKYYEGPPALPPL